MIYLINMIFMILSEVLEGIQKIKSKEKEANNYKAHGHCNARVVVEGLNMIMRGWLNYFTIKEISYPAMSNRDLRFYLLGSLNRYYCHKSQRKCRLYGQNAFETLTIRYGLIDPTN